MKLHLPKSLRSALLATFASVVAFSSSSAWAGNWGNNGAQGTANSVYYVSATETKVDATAGNQANITELYLAQAVDGEQANGSKAATIEELLLKAGDTLTVETHPWKSGGSVNFSLLTIENITIGGASESDSAVLKVNANQGVLVDSVTGTLAGVTNDGALTLGSLEISGDISNSGTLKIAGTLTGSGNITGAGSVKIDTVSCMGAFRGMVYTYADGSVATSDACFVKGSQTFQVLEEGVSYDGDVYINDSQTATKIGENGYVTVDFGDSSVFYVNDVWSYNATQAAGASYFNVTRNGVLVLDSAEQNPNEAILKEGTGTILIATGVQVSNASTKFTGDLVVGNGGDSFHTLTIGGGVWVDGNIETNTANVSSFGSITLDKGKIIHNAIAGTIHNLTVTANGGELHVYDQFFPKVGGEIAPITMAGTTTLNGTLVVNTTWKQKTNIDKLTGTGDLNILAASNAGSEDSVSVSIKDFDNYSGHITVNHKAGSKETVLTLGNNQAFGKNKYDKLSVTLNDGAKLLIDGGDDNSNDGARDGQYFGKLELGNNTLVNITDGSYYFCEGIYVKDGAATTIENRWDKTQTVKGLYGANSAEITLKRSDQADWNSNYRTFVLTAEGDFSGVIHLRNEERTYSYIHGLTVKDAAGGALENAVIDFGSGDADNGSVLVFSNKVDAADGEKLDGKVAGLSGTKGRVYAKNLTINVAESATHTYNGEIHVETLTKTGAGTQVFTRDWGAAVTIDGGVLEYQVNDTRTHTGTIGGSATFRKSGTGSLTLNSVNTTVANLDVTGGTLVYDVAEGEKAHTLTGTAASTFEKTGAGTLQLGELSSYDYNGALVISNGKVAFTSNGEEHVAAVPSFAKLFNNLTTTGTGEAEIIGDVKLYYQNETAEDCSLSLEGKLNISGYLDINSWASSNSPDGDGFRRWSVVEGGNLNVGDYLWLTNKQKMVIAGGTVSALNGVRLGHEQNDPTGKYKSTLLLEDGSLTTSSFTFYAGGSEIIMSGGELIFAPTTDGDSVLKNSYTGDNPGINKFTVTGGVLKATDAGWSLTGSSNNVVSLGGVTFDIAENKTITLDGRIALTGELTVTGAGELLLGSTEFAITESTLNNLSAVVNDVDSDKNGIGTVRYQVISGAHSLKDGSDVAVSLEGVSTSFLWDSGDIVVNKAFIVNTNFSTQNATSDNGAVGANAFYVTENGVFSIAGDIAGGKTVSALLTDTLGNGRMELQTNATLGNNSTTQFGGTLEIASGATLSIGSDEKHSIDLSSLREICLDGGNIYYRAAGGEINHLNVTGNSCFHIFDMDATKLTVNQITVADKSTFTLNATQALTGISDTTAWNHQIDIGVLIGKGTAVFNGVGTLGEGAVSTLNISSLKGFEGEIIINSRENDAQKDRYKAVIRTGIDGADFNKLSISGFKSETCTFVVEGNTSVDILNAANGIVSLDNGTTLTLGDGATDTMHSIGTLSASAGSVIRLNDKATLAYLASVSGSTVTLTGSGIYDLGSSNNLGNKVSLGDTWTGTVKITNTHIGAFNPASYGNANSAVELCGVTAWMAENSQMASLLKLTKDGDKNGLTITDGSNWTHTFSGKVTGEGDFTISGTGNGTPTFVFTGDLSEWKGAFREENASVDKTVTLNLTGGGTLFADAAAGVYMNQSVDGKFAVIVGHDSKDTTMRGTVSNAGSAGELNLTVQGNTTFEADVTATQVTVNSGKTAKLGDVATISGQNGNAVLTKVHMNSVGISGTANAGASSVKDALLELKSGASFTVKDVDLSNVTLSAEAKDTLVQLQNVTGVATLQTGPYEVQAVKSAAAVASTTTLNYELAGAVELTLANSETAVVIMANPWADCGEEMAAYDLTFSMNLTLGEGFSVADMTGEDWRDLVSFGGAFGELLDAQGAIYGVTQDDIAALTDNPFVFYDYSVTDGIGSLVVRVQGVTIPEPTTATLSLLALAALAARRRRK